MRKTSRIQWFILLDILTVSRTNIKFVFYRLIGKIGEHEDKNIW